MADETGAAAAQSTDEADTAAKETGKDESRATAAAQSADEVGATEKETGKDGSSADVTDQVEQWKSHARKWEKLAKANSEKARQWDAAQAEKAEVTDDNTARELARTKAELHAAEAALEHGLTKEQLAVLGDPLADDYPERAKALAALMKAPAPAGRRAPALGSEHAPGAGSGDFLRDALSYKN